MLTIEQARLQLLGEVATVPGVHRRMSGSDAKQWVIDWLLDRCAKEMTERETDVDLLRHSILMYEQTTIPELRGRHQMEILALQAQLAVTPPEFEFNCDEEDCSCHDEWDPGVLRHKIGNLKQRETFLIEIISRAHNYVTDPKLRATMRRIAPLPPRKPEDM